MCGKCDFALSEDDLRFDLRSMRKWEVIDFALRFHRIAVERGHRIDELERRQLCRSSFGECDCE